MKKVLKSEIARLVVEIKSIKNKINSLKWKPGFSTEIAAIQSDRTKGSKALRQYSRPETGEERHSLKDDMTHKQRPNVRSLLLAYAFIRNRKYKVAENSARADNGFHLGVCSELCKLIGVKYTYDNCVLLRTWIDQDVYPCDIPGIAESPFYFLVKPKQAA